MNSSVDQCRGAPIDVGCCPGGKFLFLPSVSNKLMTQSPDTLGVKYAGAEP